MRYCNECGSDVGINDIFCSECGMELTSKKKNNEDKTIKKNRPISADVKVEITNATTEKAFKKVGETIDSGKEVAKTTVSFTKKIFLPVVVLLTIAGIVGTSVEIYEQKERVERNNEYMERTSVKEKQNRLREERSCVIQEFKRSKSIVGDIFDTNMIWSLVQKNCDLSYTEVEKYQKKLGKNLENL